VRYFIILLVCLLSQFIPQANAMTSPQSGYFVAPYGSPSGDGSPERPFDLVTVLGASSPLQAGQTAWLIGGNYHGDYETYLANATIRALPGQDVVLDGSITSWGAGATFWGLETYDTDFTNRITTIVGDVPVGNHLPGFVIYGERNRLINNVIHDTVGGISAWSTSLDTELYGNIIYNVGWKGPDRGHGHGFYIQNRELTHPKILEHNILVSSFAPNVIAAYGSLIAYVYGVHAIGNVTTNRDVLIQGDGNTVVRDNHFYRSSTTIQGRSNRNPNPDVIVEDNYLSNFVPNFHALNFDNWMAATVRNNQIVAGDDANPSLVAFSILPPNRVYDWNNNHYFYRKRAEWQTFRWHGYAFYNWLQWKALGHDANGTYTAGLPADSVHVIPNKYEPGRGHVVVYNWTRQNTVSVDLFPLALTIGRTYRLRVAQNYANSIMEFVYDGSPLTVGMAGYPVALPCGYDIPLVSSSYPDFGVFIVEPGN
jgi:hypothetical protein